MFPYLLQHIEFNISREILIRFCRQFEHHMDNPVAFYTIHLNQIHKYPELSHFVYQYAIETVCKKHLILNTELMTLFNDNIPIIDMYRNLNKGFSDGSTFNSLMLIEQVSRNCKLFAKGEVCVVSTPLEYQTKKYYAIQQNDRDTSEYIKSSRATTDNTNAEVIWKGHTYDIKHSKKVSTNSNHIYPKTYEEMDDEKLLSYLRALLAQFKRDLSTTATGRILIERLTYLLQDHSIPISKKNILWNEFVSEVRLSTPKEVALPIVVRMTDEPFRVREPKFLTEKVHIPPDLMEKPSAAINAITGATVALGQKFNINAHKFSKGIIPIITNDISDDTILD